MPHWKEPNVHPMSIFKLMALCDTLVCDSENWFTYQSLFTLSSVVVLFVLFVFGKAQTKPPNL